MKKNISQILAACVFLVGLAVFLYPTFSNLWNEHVNSKLISDYVQEETEENNIQQRQMLEDARLYNQYMHDKEKLDVLGLSYENVLNPTGNGVMGYLEIPKISVELVIYHTLEDTQLQSGIGHMEESALPVGGDSTHCVLAGHSGLPSAKLLTNLDQMGIGDLFSIHVAGEELVYQIEDISVVLPFEVDRLAVESGRDLVTLVTCTPYGINSHRLLVKGSRVTDEIRVEGNMLFLADEISWVSPLYLIPVGVLIFLIVMGLYVKGNRKKEQKHEKNKKEHKK